MVGKAGTSQRKYSNLLYPAAIWNSCFFFFFQTEMLQRRQGYIFNPSAPFWKLCPKQKDLFMYLLRTFLVVQRVKSLSIMQETWVWSLGLIPGSGRSPRDSNHSGILAWRIPWTEEPGGLQTTGLQRVEYSWATNIFTFKYMLNTRKTTLMFTCDVGLTSFYSSESDFAWASL